MTRDEGARYARMEAALQRIVDWSDAYPVSAFPEPDGDYFRRAHETLAALGMSLDQLQASAMRHAIKGAGQIARHGLGSD